MTIISLATKRSDPVEPHRADVYMYVCVPVYVNTQTCSRDKSGIINCL